MNEEDELHIILKYGKPDWEYPATAARNYVQYLINLPRDFLLTYGYIDHVYIIHEVDGLDYWVQYGQFVEHLIHNLIEYEQNRNQHLNKTSTR